MVRRLGPLLIALSALGMWGASRMVWVEATSEDDKSGAEVQQIIGASWSLELMAVTLLLLAGAVAGFALRRLGRRIVGIICAIAAAGVALSPIFLLTNGAETERAEKILQAGNSQSNAVDVASISEWATVVFTEVNAWGPSVAVLAAAVGFFGSVLLVMKPGQDTAKSRKYETVSVRHEKLAEDLENSPDSERVMWDALDADLDPTDLERK